MANLLTETFHPGFRGQGDEVVGDPQNRPVCLDALPGAHKHLPEAQMLLDILVKGLDGETLSVNPRHLEFRHVESVGDKEAMLVSQAGNEKLHPAHLGQPDDLGSSPKPFLLGDPHPFVRKPPLGQKMDSDLDGVPIDVTILFQGGQKNPACLLDRIENRSTGIPGIHNDREPSWEAKEGFVEDFESQLDFAFESARLRDFPGTVAANGKDKPQGPCFEECRHRAEALLKSLGRMMQSQALDSLAFPGGQGIVQNQKGVFEPFHHRLTKSLKLFLELGDNASRILEKVMKAVGIASAEVGGDFPDGAKLHQPDKANQVNQEILPLRLGEHLQERAEIRRNLFRARLAHGFRVVLLALGGIGDFGWKPFCLNELLSSVT